MQNTYWRFEIRTLRLEIRSSIWNFESRISNRAISGLLFLSLFLCLPLFAQTEQVKPLPLVHPPGEGAAPPVITLQDALDRARKFDPTLQSAITDAAVAREDRAQAKQSLLPSV